MDIKSLTPNLSVSPQILASELQAVADAGFKALICNRPDGEGADQPSFDEIAQAAARLGLQARYLPAETGKVRDEDGKAFGALLHTLPGPVLAYCRTGKLVSRPCRRFWKPVARPALTCSTWCNASPTAV